jgi:aspartate/glutamate racemase
LRALGCPSPLQRAGCDPRGVIGANERAHLSSEMALAMAASDVVTDGQREIFRSAGRRLISAGGAEAIMLGGTDLALAFDVNNPPFPILDCAGIHADAIARLAIP